MENRFSCLKSEPNDGAGGDDTASSWLGKKYGWYHTLNGIVANTPGMTEDLIFEWPVMRFLKRLQYLSDVWENEKHDAELAKLQNAKH